jgi:hypothetical protein
MCIIVSLYMHMNFSVDYLYSNEGKIRKKSVEKKSVVADENAEMGMNDRGIYRCIYICVF